LAQFSPARNGELNSSPNWKRLSTTKNYAAFLLLALIFPHTKGQFAKKNSAYKKSMNIYTKLVVIIKLCVLFVSVLRFVSLSATASGLCAYTAIRLHSTRCTRVCAQTAETTRIYMPRAQQASGFLSCASRFLFLWQLLIS
jgi:hypothetical protein